MYTTCIYELKKKKVSGCIKCFATQITANLSVITNIEININKWNNIIGLVIVIELLLKIVSQRA